ncbi:MAG: hypothetical protein OEY01_15880 [Desulfobulbaceae bacterium]|nr:hypothetical protein [Desulfobulbaceae bacterium]
MPRLMSFRLTIAQFRARTKDVTRRLGWTDLRLGDRLVAVEQAMGLKKGETVTRLGEIEIVSLRLEPLYLADDVEVAREGFPGMAPEEFVEMFCRANSCQPETMVTRIEYRYCDDEPAGSLVVYPDKETAMAEVATHCDPELKS